MNMSENIGRLGRGTPAKISVSPRSSPLETFREKESLRLSDSYSILMTYVKSVQINR